MAFCIFSSLHFKHTAANLKCKGNKRTMRHWGLETSIYFPFGILLNITALFCPFCERYTAHKYCLCANTIPLLILKRTLWTDLLVSDIRVFFRAFFTPTFLSKCLAGLESASSYSSVLILECCCYKSCGTSGHHVSKDGILYLKVICSTFQKCGTWFCYFLL